MKMPFVLLTCVMEWSKETVNEMGCTLAPPGEYNRTIRWWRCGLSLLLLYQFVEVFADAMGNLKFGRFLHCKVILLYRLFYCLLF